MPEDALGAGNPVALQHHGAMAELESPRSSLDRASGIDRRQVELRPVGQSFEHRAPIRRRLGKHHRQRDRRRAGAVPEPALRRPALGAIGAPAAGPSDRAAWQPGVEPERGPHEHVAVAPTRRRERAGGGTAGLVAAEAPLERVDELGERRRSVGFGPVGQRATRTHQPGQLDSLGVHLRAEPLDLCHRDALLAFAL